MNHIIVNPTSRTGQTEEIWKEIEACLKQENIPYQLHESSYPGHVTEIARQISEQAGEKSAESSNSRAGRNATEKPEMQAGRTTAEKPEMQAEYKNPPADKNSPEEERENIFLVGGDGTANEVINGITDFSRIRFGYIPTGSGNDLGRGLQVGSDPVSRMKHLLKSRETVQMDLGEVCLSNGKTRRFAISAGIGLDAEACRRAQTSELKVRLNKLGLGKLTYALLTVSALFSMPFADGTLSYRNKKGEVKTLHVKKMIFAAAMNHKWEGGGVPMAPKADAFDGRLSMITVGGLFRLQALCLFPLLLLGKQERSKHFHHLNTSSITIRTNKPMVIHADGEVCGTATAVRFTCLPGKLTVIV